MPVTSFKITFNPAQEAVTLLTAIANDEGNKFQQSAMLAVNHWRDSLATPGQRALAEDKLPLNDELKLDDEGVCVSEGSDPGFFVQTWSWVPTDGDDG